jgi:hypothetical protein
MKTFKEFLTESPNKNRTNLVNFRCLNQVSNPKEEWHGIFDCRRSAELSKLTSLEGAPSMIYGGNFADFLCNGNKITSLEHGPKQVGGDYWCHDNSLTSLEGVASLIGGELNARTNKIASLHNIHKMVKSVGRSIDVNDNPIKECVLGLLKIKNLARVWMDHNRDDCQAELIEAGFDEYAKL